MIGIELLLIPACTRTLAQRLSDWSLYRYRKKNSNTLSIPRMFNMDCPSRGQLSESPSEHKSKYLCITLIRFRELFRSLCQMIFMVKLIGLTHVVPFVADASDNIVLKTIFRSTKFHNFFEAKTTL